MTFIDYGSVPKVTLLAVVRTGNIDEGEDTWLPDVAVEMLKEGTTTRSAYDIAKAAAGMGGALGLGVGAEQTTASISVLSDHAVAAVELLADVLRNPRFPESELPRVRANFERSLAVARADPQSLADEALAKLVFGDHPFGRVLPREGQLAGYDIAKLRDFYDRNFGARRTHVYVAGRYDRQRARGGAAPGLQRLARRRSRPRTCRRSRADGLQLALVDSPGAPQSSVRMAVPVPDPASALYFQTTLMNSLLGGTFGSRITSNIREDKGYSYSPDSSINARRGGALWITVRGDHGRAHGRGDHRDLQRDRAAATRGAHRRGADARQELPRGRVRDLEFLAERRARASSPSWTCTACPTTSSSHWVANVQAVTPAQVSDMARRVRPPGAHDRRRRGRPRQDRRQRAGAAAVRGGANAVTDRDVMEYDVVDRRRRSRRPRHRDPLQGAPARAQRLRAGEGLGDRRAAHLGLRPRTRARSMPCCRAGARRRPTSACRRRATSSGTSRRPAARGCRRRRRCTTAATSSSRSGSWRRCSPRAPRRSASTSFPASPPPRHWSRTAAWRACASATWASTATASPARTTRRARTSARERRSSRRAAAAASPSSSIARLGLADGRQPQTFGLGIKELWQLPAGRAEPGLIQHTVGWPVDARTYGGSFLYHLDRDRVYVGYVAGLDYEDPRFKPFEAFQQFKHHPRIRALLEGGEILAYGARTIAAGGWQSLPRMDAPGLLLVGDSAGTLNVPKIKGVHQAIRCGVLAAEHLAETGGTAGFEARWRDSAGGRELKRVRNIKPGFHRGLWWGLANGALETALAGPHALDAVAHGEPPRAAPPRDRARRRSRMGRARPAAARPACRRLPCRQRPRRRRSRSTSLVSDTSICATRCIDRVRQSLRELLPGQRLRDGRRRRGRPAPADQRRELRALQGLRHQGSLRHHHVDHA